MSRPEHNYLPVVPDALETEEFLPIVIEDGREIRRRERVDIRSTYERALADAQQRAANWNRSGSGTAYGLVLRRAVGLWELAER
jgi:hypothetical protein